MDPAYSIIIPHHNIPDLLERCLKSIPQRDDLQVIVVDDNSDYRFLPKLKCLENRYLSWEFIFLTGERKGAGHARNVGLDIARGEWLLFADSDDFYVQDISSILDSYKNAVEDILYFRNLSVMSDDITQPSERDNWTNWLYNRYLDNQNERLIRCNHCVPWGKIIRHEFVSRNNIRFDEVLFSNDVMFGIQTGCKAKLIKIINHPMYILTERADSLSNAFASKPGELATRMEVSYRAFSFLKEQGYSFDELYGHFSLPVFMSKAFHKDRELFTCYFYKLATIYPSYASALKQIRLNETNRWDKLKLYLYSGWLILRKSIQKS